MDETTKDATARPWRVGDAGATVFGPPNGNPAPETVASVRNRANAAIIVRAVNAHEAMVDVVHDCIDLLNRPNLTIRERSTINKARAALALAKGKD